MEILDKDLQESIVSAIQNALHEHNALLQQFKTALEKAPSDFNFQVVIRADKRPSNGHPRTWNVPEVDEVAVLVAGSDKHALPRDIVIESQWISSQSSGNS